MHDFFNFLGFATFWIIVAAIVIVPLYLRQRDRDKMHETLRIALQTGQPLPPEMISALQQSVRTPSKPPTPERDLRTGLVLLAVGLGLCAIGYGFWWGLMSVSDVGAYMTGVSFAGFGAIPGMIGIAYIIIWAVRRKSPEAPEAKN
ncbi:MAG: hypothetical protein KGL69_11770 [Alphaproteobacteria bacterium]|nr:hypothetical protein [Alphaproteobacteria bacterium]